MGNIFGNVEPPRWLQEIAKPIDTKKTGQALGLFLGAGLKALERDPDAPADASWLGSRKGFETGLDEARKSQEDPQWRLKEQALETHVVGNWMRNASEWQALEMTKKDWSQWTTEDLPTLARFTEELKQDPNAAAPVMKSARGQKAIQQIETSRLRKAQMDHTYEMRKAQLENASEEGKMARDDTGDFIQSLRALPPEANDVVAAIGARKGEVIAGVRTYSNEQWTMLKNALKKYNMPMPGERRKAGFPVTPQQKAALDDLKADESEIRKELVRAKAAGDKDQQAQLEAQLDDVKKKRLKISALVGAEATGMSVEDILDDKGEPTDEMATTLRTAQREYNKAVIKGDPEAISKAQATLDAAQIQVANAQSLQKGYVIDTTKLNESGLATVASWPVGTRYFDKGQRTWNVLDAGQHQAWVNRMEEAKKAKPGPSWQTPLVWKDGVLQKP